MQAVSPEPDAVESMNGSGLNKKIHKNMVRVDVEYPDSSSIGNVHIQIK